MKMNDNDNGDGDDDDDDDYDDDDDDDTYVCFTQSACKKSIYVCPARSQNGVKCPDGFKQNLTKQASKWQVLFTFKHLSWGF